jgi:zinc protease
MARTENAHDPGLFFASVSCAPEKLDQVRDSLVSTLESLGDVPFTEAEVSLAKVRNKRTAEQLQANAQAMSQALSSASSHGDWRLVFVQRDRVAAVTAADVNRVAKTYFQKPNRTVGVYIPSKESTRLAVPSAPPIDLVVKDYKGGAVAASGEAFDPSPANLDSRVKVIKEPGLKAGFLPKKNRGETVSLVLTLHYGNVKSLNGQSAAAGMLPGLMMA